MAEDDSELIVGRGALPAVGFRVCLEGAARVRIARPRAALLRFVQLDSAVDRIAAVASCRFYVKKLMVSMSWAGVGGWSSRQTRRAR